ncbi:MAG TPA: BON domain-containing protein [Phycisphaerales bacterium]|nr:BON domain-containing protein [Phycisphaerales bacterium]
MYARTLPLLLVSSLIVASSCNKSPDQPGNNKPATTTPATPPKADNTDRNKADQNSGTKTPVDQSNSAAATKITAEIRRAIMDDKGMSVNAQNCKIITDEAGVVTLRGPVDSQAEKDSIESKAKAVAGVTRVVNELEVKTH